MHCLRAPKIATIEVLFNLEDLIYRESDGIQISSECDLTQVNYGLDSKAAHRGVSTGYALVVQMRKTWPVPWMIFRYPPNHAP